MTGNTGRRISEGQISETLLYLVNSASHRKSARIICSNKFNYILNNATFFPYISVIYGRIGTNGTVGFVIRFSKKNVALQNFCKIRR